MLRHHLLALPAALFLIPPPGFGQEPVRELFPDHPVNTWVKRSPLPDGPPSPRLGYEGATVWSSAHQVVIRYGGHNQGGGGEQGSEVWTFDLATGAWNLMEADTSPPGVCCNAQNICLPDGDYIRFPKFSGGHGWQWFREIHLNDSPVWNYDLRENRWRDRRPYPCPRLAPYRAASWDSHHRLIVMFGGEGNNEGTRLYDPWRNEWRWPEPELEPASRSGGNLAYDAARKLHVLFGCQFKDDPHTWTYSVERNEWRDMKPPSQPTTQGNDAVLTYDSVNQVVLALIKVGHGKLFDQPPHDVQTWAYDTGANTWTRMRPDPEPEPAGNRTRNLMFAPEHNLVILESCTSKPREQQIWTYRYADRADAPPPPPDPPPPAPDGPPIVEDLVVSVLATNRVELSWGPPAADDIAGYRVERAPVEVWTTDQLPRIKNQTPPLPRPSVGAIRKVGTFVRLNPEPIAVTQLVDTAIDLGRPLAIEGDPIHDSGFYDRHLDHSGKAYDKAVFAYRVRAVDAAGRVGGPSRAVLTIPSSPTQLFSREDGVTAHIRWTANPERGVVGYRVYRMDGQYAKTPIRRLTAEPIAATEFTDPDAGTRSRRYYVVGVDALGQEGFPSSPVWFKRTWAKYYLPFIGDWHQ